MSTTLSGLAGLTKAYVSVLSASGSWLMSGASRWLDARGVVDPNRHEHARDSEQEQHPPHPHLLPHSTRLRFGEDYGGEGISDWQIDDYELRMAEG